MPIESKVDPATGILTFREEGAVTDAQQAEIFGDLLRRKLIRPPFRVLIDRRAITKSWGRAEVLGTAERLTSYGKILEGARIAIVVGRQVAFGNVRMMQAYTEKLSVKLRGFYEEAEAIEWLRDGDP